VRRILPASFAILTSLLALAAHPDAARAADSADECVAVRRTEQSAGLDFEVQNNCDKNLRCGLGWTLTCENDSGKATRSTHKNARFSVEASTSHHELGSAAACNGNWRIQDVTWECAAAQ
jgi:hypothetical protein